MTDSAGSDDPWDPDIYHRFAAQRRKPFDDLVARIEPVPGGRLVDLGCGSGELTAVARTALAVAEAVGVDNSPAMLAEAAQIEVPGLHFEPGDLATFHQPDEWDVVLANASLQWVPDHHNVLRRWVDSLRPGGQLAVQVPANPDHPAHTTVAEVLAEQPFEDHASDVGPDHLANVVDPARYAEILFELGAEDPLVRLQVYGMAMPKADDVVDWVSGTALDTGATGAPTRPLRALRRPLSGAAARAPRPRIALLLRLQADPDVGPLSLTFSRPRSG